MGDLFEGCTTPSGSESEYSLEVVIKMTVRYRKDWILFCLHFGAVMFRWWDRWWRHQNHCWICNRGDVPDRWWKPRSFIIIIVVVQARRRYIMELARVIMSKADSFVHNNEVTLTEMRTYLQGTEFHDFMEWMNQFQDGSKVWNIAWLVGCLEPFWVWACNFSAATAPF